MNLQLAIQQGKRRGQNPTPEVLAPAAWQPVKNGYELDLFQVNGLKPLLAYLNKKV